jgi:hypothetical protein
VIHSYIFSPLTSIPNAGILAPLSRLSWAFVAEHCGTITLELPVLHDKLGEAFLVDWNRKMLSLHPETEENRIDHIIGSLVRIGPNEVSFYSVEIYKEIHATGNKYIKDPRVYGQFVQNAHPSLFSLT